MAGNVEDIRGNINRVVKDMVQTVSVGADSFSDW